jgi:large subunit ribosomal protein L25
MATSAQLKAQPRQDTGKSATRKMRAAGRIPAVVYGHGDETRKLTVDAHELELLFKRVHYENTIIEVDIEGEPAPVKTLIREVQSHAYRPDVLHVDFQQVHADEPIHVEIPIHLLGTAPGTRLGGVLMQVITDLEVRCLPDRIPEVIEIDISHMQINDAVHLRDLTLPPGVEPLIDADRTICSITPPSVMVTEEGAEEVAAEDTSEPEVIGKGREDEEGE